MIVIDTHVVVWGTSGIPSQLSVAARRSIVDSDAVAFSAVSVWEIGTLARRGRIVLHLDIDHWLREVTEVHSLEILPVTLDIALCATELHDILRDPVDCLIAATALTHSVPLVTKDDRVRNSGVIETIW